ncbi:MAG: AMIN domain-containing protein [Gammaproteobacteria bacterium]|nr:AMIN domain-containing protein [Gammaproteobacteria bacterium]
MWKYGFKQIGFLALALPSVLAHGGTLQNIRAYEAPDHTRVVFDTSASAEASIFVLSDPDRLVIDLANTRPAASFDPDVSGAMGRRVKNIRWGARPSAYRVVLDLDKPLKRKDFQLPPIAPYGHRLVIDLFDERPAEPPPKPTEPEGLRPVVIAIDAGHGGEDPGAIGPNRVYEKRITLSIARKLAAQFNQTPGYRAVLVRTGDYYIPLRRRTQIAHRERAHLFLSIHADAFKNPKVSGASVYMLSERGADSEMARYLAEKENRSDLFGGVSDVSVDDMEPYLRQTLTDLSMQGKRRQSSEVGGEVLSQLDRVTKLHKKQVGHAGFVVLKAPDIPSLLIETGFISNPTEARRLNQADHQDKLVRAIHRGVVNYWRDNPPPGTLLAQNTAGEMSHRIQRGDTLSGIAARYGTSVARIRQANGLAGNRIRVGQVLTIPADG